MIGLNQSAFVVQGAATIGLSQMFTIAPTASDPTYIVLSLLDRNEYTAGVNGMLGTISGNGNSLGLINSIDDFYTASIVFAYDPATHRYSNSTYGYLDQLSYTASNSLNDITSISITETNDLATANYDASNVFGGMNNTISANADNIGFASSVIATQPGFTGPVPAQATPSSIAAVANSFVGKTWNSSGCWILANTIAAEAGAGLPVQSTLSCIPGVNNGEWTVVFNGPAGSTGNWQSMVTAGEIIVISGHITTCVSGSGGSAMLVDNAEFISGSHITNLANDGSSSDIIIQPAHAASQEWSGVPYQNVVIYELDTPVITDNVIAVNAAGNGTLPLAPLFTATDPAGKTITSWQVYDTLYLDTLLVDGVSTTAYSASAAVTVGSLSSVSLQTNGNIGTDMVEVRAYNGTYWGDWQSMKVFVGGTTNVYAPILVTKTPNQNLIPNQCFSVVVLAATFKDPMGQKMTYKATQTNGAALPSWMHFSATTDSFSGVAPVAPVNVNVAVTATNTSGLSTTETFVIGDSPNPVVTNQTPDQHWATNSCFSLNLPMIGAGVHPVFTDPNGLKMTLSAIQLTGADVSRWLHFNSSTGSFSGATPRGLSETFSIQVTATNTNHYSGSEVINITVGTSGTSACIAPAHT